MRLTTAVTHTIVLAKRTLHTVRGNLAWTVGYDIAALPIAALGMLNPLIAGRGDVAVVTARGDAAGRSDYQPQE